MNLLYLSSIELRQICYFLAIVEAGNNFSRAAEYLQIEQPPLSQRIKALERKLKFQLFDRKRRPLQLTAAGEIFLAEMRQSLTMLEQAITHSQQASRGEIGFLSIGIASSISNTILPDILKIFCAKFPAVELELRELTAEQQIQALKNCQLDIGFEVISHFQLPDHNLSIQPIVTESLVIALPETHPLATQPQISLRALAQEALILPSLTAFPFYQKFIDYCEQAGFQPRIVQQAKATWLITILSLVVAGVGIAILPSNVENIQRQGVVYRSISDINLTREISVMWRTDQLSTSTVMREFLKVVQEISGRQISPDIH
jgi:DNA-binding transcriptional LysR family regulator